MNERLPTTADTVVKDACPSRMVDHDTGEILHCGSNHATEEKHFAPGSGWSWSDVGAMPADRPCDRHCPQCVERTRDAVLDAAIAWYDTGEEKRRVDWKAADDVLINAIYEYRKVAGR